MSLAHPLFIASASKVFHNYHDDNNHHRLVLMENIKQPKSVRV